MNNISLSLKEQKILWSVLNQAQDIGLRSVGQLIQQYDNSVAVRALSKTKTDKDVTLKALVDWLNQTQEEYDILNTLKVKLCGDLE